MFKLGRNPGYVPKEYDGYLSFPRKQPRRGRNTAATPMLQTTQQNQKEAIWWSSLGSWYLLCLAGAHYHQLGAGRSMHFGS